MDDHTLSHRRLVREPVKRPCVAVVEDDGALLSALRFSLEAEGYEVRTFANQIDLLAHQDAVHGIACLIVDYRLNPLNGLELFVLLQSRGMTAPAILVTSNPDEECRREAARLGVPIVEKPLLTDALSRLVAQLVDATSLN
ncbi:MAG TPA: response regulator [Caulobacteraceae bacterium]|nr:response regulator [Caulobacteraceae bacterium]